MSTDFPLEPREVPAVKTNHRQIVTAIPVPESIPILKRLHEFEPIAMRGQPAVVWDRAEGICVHDRWGNQWLDWSCGVVVTNAGHAHPMIRKAVVDQVHHGLMHNYCFPSEIRARLVEALSGVAPEGLTKVFLLTTGSETTECAIKLMRSHGLRAGGKRKIGIVTFANAFHGRTLGAQMAGGSPKLKAWIVNLDPAMVQVPFPDGFFQTDTGFEVFTQTLDQHGLGPQDIAGVMLETFQGFSASFAPVDYIRKLRAWCDQHDVVLTFDEVQAAFGRTGRFWGFEHYGIQADLICCGKGISSGMPLSAVIGRPHLIDQYPPGSMTSTHTGNPVCAAAVLANLDVIKDENLVERARQLGPVLERGLKRLAARFAPRIGDARSKGLVGAIQLVSGKSTPTPDPDKKLAIAIVRRCIEKGLMLFAPVGESSVKIAPPLITPEEALLEGIEVLEEAIEESLAQ